MPTKSEEENKKTGSKHKSTKSEHGDEAFFDGHEVQTLLSWEAPGRPFIQRSREFYINSLLIVLALQVILFLFSQYLLMLVVASLAFLVFALSVTPPHSVKYHISTEGVAVDDHFYLWQELYDFYFRTQHGVTMLHIRTKSYFVGELIFMLGEVPKDILQQVLIMFLPYREIVKPTFTEKAGDWVAKSFPLEKPKHHHAEQAHHHTASHSHKPA